MQSTDSVYTVYGGFFVRLAAYLTDGLLFGVLSLALRLPQWLGALSGGPLETPLLFSFTAWDLLIYLASAAYFVLLTYYSGATLGKKLFHLRVLTAEGGRPSFFTVLYRETIGRYLSSLLFVGYLLVGLTAEKKGLHDILCDTRVVYTCRFLKVTVPTQAYGTPVAASPCAAASPYAFPQAPVSPVPAAEPPMYTEAPPESVQVPPEGVQVPPESREIPPERWESSQTNEE